MQVKQQPAASERYAKCIEVSKRVRWEIDRDVIRQMQRIGAALAPIVA
jgi:hypothetical protein